MKKHLLPFLLLFICLFICIINKAQTPSPRGVPNRPPVAHDDTARVAQPDSITVNVRANDTDPDGNSLCITNIYGSHRFTLTNCDSITYHSDTSLVGIDTCTYRICDNGLPVLCDTGMLVIFIDPAPPTLVAHDDTASVIQPDTITINVASNDIGPNGDILCITNISGSPQFTITSCDSITFHPDSNFVGKDTCRYQICDYSIINPGSTLLCDTAMLVVTVNPNYTLWPVAGFVSDSINNYSILFHKPCGYGWVYPYIDYKVKSTSTNADSLVWTFRVISEYSYCLDSTKSFSGDSIIFQIAQLWESCFWEYDKLELCLTAHNKFGSNTMCDTICDIAWEGINELQLSGISIYPNPASNILTIDMRNNNDEITSNYAAIEIYNALGQKVKTIPRKDLTKVLNIPVTGLAEGAYLAAIIDSKGVKRILGRFVKE